MVYVESEISFTLSYFDLVIKNVSLLIPYRSNKRFYNIKVDQRLEIRINSSSPINIYHFYFSCVYRDTYCLEITMKIINVKLFRFSL